MALDTPTRHSLQLNALRAFEASARLGGFARAALELKVSPGAIAALVKTLESEYGAALFERHAKGVRLTALGESVKTQFTEAFDAVEAAARTLRRLAAPQRVHIVTSPALRNCGSGHACLSLPACWRPSRSRSRRWTSHPTSSAARSTCACSTPKSPSAGSVGSPRKK